MVLDFGLIGNEGVVQTADYKSAGSHQVENMSFVEHSAADTYDTLKTVTTGKTFYCSFISVAGGNAAYIYLATGSAGSEADFMIVRTDATQTEKFTFSTPLKFQSGTRISTKTTFHSGGVSMVGWEE